MIDEYDNLGPIQDAAVVDMGRQGAWLLQTLVIENTIEP